MTARPAPWAWVCEYTAEQAVMMLKDNNIPQAEVSHRNRRPSLSQAREPAIAANQFQIWRPPLKPAC